MFTLVDLLVSLRSRLRSAMDRKDTETCSELMTTFNHMLGASDGDENLPLRRLLDDLECAAQHAAMGVDWKAEACIPSEERIYSLFQGNSETLTTGQP